MGLATQGRHWLGSTGDLETRGRGRQPMPSPRKRHHGLNWTVPPHFSLQSSCLYGQIEVPDLTPFSCLPSYYLWVQSVLPSQDVQEGHSLLKNQTHFLSNASSIIPQKVFAEVTNS